MRLPCLALVALALAGGACVSKSDHQALEAQLAACLDDKKAAQASADGFRDRLAKDDSRWQTIETQLTTVLPQMQQDFETDREEIIKLVPAEVRKQVGDRLDAHFAKLSGSMNRMSEDVTTLRTELQQARDEIAAVKGATEQVGAKVDNESSALREENARLLAFIDGQRAEAAELVRDVTEFDKNYLNCVDCEERLKMKDKSREALLSLHSSLVSGLSRLQAGAE